MKQIIADIKAASYKPVYLITGEEAYLRQDLKRRLTEAIVGDNTMNYLYLEGREADPVVIMDNAETLPFFADHRLIVVENSGFFKKEAGGLADYLGRMPDTTILVFVEEAVDKRNRLYKKVKAAGYIAECNRQNTRQLANWAARGLAKAGKKISAPTMELFLTRTGDDMENIRQELEKLIGYTGDRDVITDADVNTITTVRIEDRIFEMIDAIATRNQKRSMDLYYDLLRLKEPPMKIMVLIARQFRAILEVKELREKGMNSGEITARCGFRPFLTDRYMKQAARFGKKELEDFVRFCVETDEAVKSGDLSDKLGAEMLIIKFTS